MTNMAAAKHENVGIIRTRVNDIRSAQYPDTSLTVEQVTAATSQYIERLAKATVIHPLSDSVGPCLANLDDEGTLQPCLALDKIIPCKETLLEFQHREALS